MGGDLVPISRRRTLAGGEEESPARAPGR
jgi:hypothetical protein